MLRILFCVVPEKGHLNPCIGPAQHLRASGHDVAFYSPGDITEALNLAGDFTFVGPINHAERHDVSRGASFAENVKDAAWLAEWIRSLLIDGTPPLVDPIRKAITTWRPDVVVIDPLLYAAAIAADMAGVPWISLSNSLNPVLATDSETLDSDLLRTVRDLAPARQEMFGRYGMQGEFRGCDVMSPYATIAFTTHALVGDPPAGVHLVGPSWPLHSRGDEAFFPWERIDSDKALVYMSLGSQLYHHPLLFKKVARALAHLPVQLVLSVGELAGSELMEGLDHDRVIALRYVSQLAVLKRAQLFITHCGANSVMEALACGVPMAMSPICNDQFHSAHYVQASGAGFRIELEQASERDITQAVEEALASDTLKSNAARMKTAYQRDGAAEAARLIEEVVLRACGTAAVDRE